MAKASFRVEPECFLTVALLLWYRQEAAVGMILAFLVLHEMGHALVYRLGGGRLRGIHITSFGIRMEMGMPLERRGFEIAAVAAGPVCNLLAAGVAFFLGFRNAGIAGLALGFYNLFPAHFLDGGLLVELIAEGMGKDASRWTRRGSMLLGCVLGGLFLVVAWQGSFSVGLFLAFLLTMMECVP